MSAKKAKTNRRAIGYVRVSTLEQADHGTSLEAQISRIRDWCTANGYVLGEVMVDKGLSGGRADNRPALQEALATVRRGDALVVYALSRLARSTRDTLEIADALDCRGADLVSLSEKIDTTSAAGRMVFRLLAVLAEFEMDVISERTSLAIVHLQAQGRYIGGGNPYGFKVENGQVIQVAGELEAIHLARRLRNEGMSLRSIVQELSAEGCLSRSGRPFIAKQVDRMIRGRTRAADGP